MVLSWWRRSLAVGVTASGLVMGGGAFWRGEAVADLPGARIEKAVRPQVDGLGMSGGFDGGGFDGRLMGLDGGPPGAETEMTLGVAAMSPDARRDFGLAPAVGLRVLTEASSEIEAAEPGGGMVWDRDSLLDVGWGLRLGAAMQSRTDAEARGSADVLGSVTMAALSPMTGMPFEVLDSRLHGAIVSPGRIAGGARWALGDSLALLAELQWTRWAVLNDLVAGGAGRWRDAWFGAVGMDWRVTRGLSAQATLAYDQGAASSARMRGFGVGDRAVAGVGFTLALARGVDLQWAYGHATALGRGRSGEAASLGLRVGL